MGNFGSGRRGGRDSGRKSSFGRSDRRGSDRPQMFSAVCANCGNDCEVPFEPRGGKPVYCSDCFREMDGGESRSDDRSSRPSRSRSSSYGGRSSGGSSTSGLSEQLAYIEKKLDKMMDILEELKSESRIHRVSKEKLEESAE